jgi:serine/threonine-protein kinase
MTKTGQFLGTLDYAAPEQFEGRPLTARTDVYSLGCVLYECLTGTVPFRKEQDAALMYAHLNEPPPRPSTERPEVRAFDRVVAKAMAKKPEERYASAGELAAAAREALPGVAPAPPGRQTVPVRRRRKRSPAALAAGTAMVVAGLIVGLIAFLAGGKGPGPASPGASSTGAATSPGPSATGSGPAPLTNFRGLVGVDPASGRIRQHGEYTLPSAVFPGAGRLQLLAAEGAIWVGTLSSGSGVDELDPGDLHVIRHVRTSSLGGSHVWLAAGDTSIWSVVEHQPVSSGPDPLYRIDPATGRVVAEIVIGENVQGVGFGPGGTWVVTSDGTLSQVRPGARSVSQTFHVSDDASGIAVGAGAVWVTSNLGSAVYRFDPRTHRSRTVSLPGAVTGIAVDASGVWVLDGAAGTVTRIDPDTLLTGDPIRVGADPSDIAVGAGYVWVADPGEGTVYRIDPASNTATPIPVATDPGPRRVSVGLGRVWLFME